MIVIVNIDENPRDTGKHLYSLRVAGKESQRELCQFTHYRENGIVRCLERAAEAYKEKQMQDIVNFVEECW